LSEFIDMRKFSEKIPAPTKLTMKKTFKRHVLPNGLRVIFVPDSQSLATMVMVLVEAGSKYESKELNGLSHFLEHMCFKGTTKRPSPLIIASELDGLGAQYNAFTLQEYTNYYAKARNESFDQILDVVADIYLNPTFDPQEIEKEKGVIIEEINMYEGKLERKVQDLFGELLYGDQPAGWPIAGRKEVIQRMAREDFIKYRNAHYVAPATIVVVAGNFDEGHALDKIAQHFKALSSNPKKGKVSVVESQDSPSELIHFKDSDQTHLMLGFRAFNVFDDRRFALDVLSDILGGGMSSRLFQRIREELGAAYYVGASANLYSDHGDILMAAGIDHKKISEVIKAVLQEFGRFKDELVGEEELKRAKNHIIGNLYLSLETSDQFGYFYGNQEVMGLPLETPEELAARINAVSAKEIQTLARELFANQTLNLALIGPFKNKSFIDILKV